MRQKLPGAYVAATTVLRERTLLWDMRRTGTPQLLGLRFGTVHLHDSGRLLAHFGLSLTTQCGENPGAYVRQQRRARSVRFRHKLVNCREAVRSWWVFGAQAGTTGPEDSKTVRSFSLAQAVSEIHS